MQYVPPTKTAFVLVEYPRLSNELRFFPEHGSDDTQASNIMITFAGDTQNAKFVDKQNTVARAFPGLEVLQSTVESTVVSKTFRIKQKMAVVDLRKHGFAVNLDYVSGEEHIFRGLGHVYSWDGVPDQPIQELHAWVDDWDIQKTLVNAQWTFGNGGSLKYQYKKVFEFIAPDERSLDTSRHLTHMDVNLAPVYDVSYGLYCSCLVRMGDTSVFASGMGSNSLVHEEDPDGESEPNYGVFAGPNRHLVHEENLGGDGEPNYGVFAGPNRHLVHEEDPDGDGEPLYRYRSGIAVTHNPLPGDGSDDGSDPGYRSGMSFEHRPRMSTEEWNRWYSSTNTRAGPPA